MWGPGGQGSSIAGPGAGAKRPRDARQAVLTAAGGMGSGLRHNRGLLKIRWSIRTMKLNEPAEYEVDVVIIGFGSAGGCAAIEARDHGAEVVILEKQPEETHFSNTRMSGGG